MHSCGFGGVDQSNFTTTLSIAGSPFAAAI
jgi:hypothetical protein